jgi:peptide/nickel transport system permease protein
LFLRKKQYESAGSLSKLAWRRLLKDKLAVGSMGMIAVAVVISVLGYLITPDHSPYANQQYLELTTKKPGFSVAMLKVRKNETAQNTSIFHTLLYGKTSDYTFIPFSRYHFRGADIVVEEFTGSEKYKGLEKTFSLADVVFPVSISRPGIRIVGNRLIFYDVDNRLQSQPISELQQTIVQKNIIQKRFLLGTDRYGRDVLSQLMIGTRVSLSVGFISVFISLVIGILLGALAGFFRGWIDNLIMWFINVVWSIPTLLLVIAITFALGKGFWQVFIAVGLTMWVEVARVVRGQMMSLREKEFVEAGKALGFRNFRIIFRHILPNVMGPVIVISAANFASAILIEAGLSFLGIGVQPPMPSWGTMLKENYAYIILHYAYLALLPGIAIMLMVLAFMLIGNGLRDALDIKTVDVKKHN